MKSVIVYNALVIVKKKNEKTKQNKNDNLPKSLAWSTCTVNIDLLGKAALLDLTFLDWFTIISLVSKP